MYDVLHNWFIDDINAMTCGMYPPQTRPESCDDDFNTLVGLLAQTGDFNPSADQWTPGDFINSTEWRQVLTNDNPSTYFTEDNPGTFFGLTNEAFCAEDSCATRDELITLLKSIETETAGAIT
jgi:hypothetical protein